MEIKTVKQNAFQPEKKSKVIRKSYLARQLLAAGNTIIDIKADKDDPDHKRSVFVFKFDDKFNHDLSRILKENELQRRERDIEREVEARLKNKIQEENKAE